ncbi:MAG: hypothetical protein HY816_11775 [Candidatus Wallbacteria bacterium]|nr:hypothetical protein [Candidatus Wallbacteria bacterium]
MPRSLPIMLLVMVLMTPVARAQAPGPVGGSVQVPGAALVSDAEQRQAERAREDARRALDELAGQDTDTISLERAREGLRRGDEFMAARNYSAAVAMYGQTVAATRTAKTVRDRSEQVAKQAEAQVKVSFAALGSQPVAPNSKEEKARVLAFQKFQQGQQALASGQFGAARRLFLDAEGFLKRVLRQTPGAVADCSDARANLDRVLPNLRRVEVALANVQNELVQGLVAKSRSLLEDARRLLASNQCDESLRTSRLAENALKRAAEMALQARRE